jgi:hypothetical protein
MQRVVARFRLVLIGVRETPGAVWAVVCAIVFFAASAGIFMRGIGIYEDEVLFAPAIYHPGDCRSFLKLFGHDFPTMLMSYLGADKVYLYGVILKVVAPSAWSLRLPVVFMGALTLWLLFVTVRRFTNDYVAATLACLIATDPVFLLTTTLDWGPVAVQHLLFAAAFACLARPQPMIFVAFFAQGAALWDKSTAVWTIVAMAVSAALFLPAYVRPNLTPRNLARAILGLVLGALPLLIFNIFHQWATLRENAIFSTAGVGAKIVAMYNALGGRDMFKPLLRGGTPEWSTLVPFTFAAALILLFRRDVAPIRPVALFALFTGLLTWLMMLFMKAGGEPHHLVLVWPWPHLFLICVLGFAFRKRVFLAIAAALILSNIVMVGLYAQRTYAFGPRESWSEATYALPSILPENKKIVTLDWGIRNTGTFLTRGRVKFEDRAFTGLREEDLPDLERTQFLTHAEGAEEFSGNNSRFDTAIHKAGYVRVVDRILSDQRGHPVIVSFHVDRLR